MIMPPRFRLMLAAVGGASSTWTHFWRLGDFFMIKEIGRGGMGIVFLARDFASDQLVAVKLIFGEQLLKKRDQLRFEREVAAASLLHHPNIVPLRRKGVVDGLHYFSMPYFSGGDLHQNLGRFAKKLEESAKLVAKIAQAIHYAHHRGVVHRDLKPANILLDDTGEPHVTDFGLAKFAREAIALTLPGEVMGTPAYMAPEQANGHSRTAGEAADIWSLGIILYRLITGRLPFAATHNEDITKRILDQQPLLPSARNPKVDSDLELICLKCLRKDPKLRHRSAKLLAQALEHWLRGSSGAKANK